MSLIGLSAEQVQERLIRLDKEITDFKSELFRISWYMRGGVTVNDLLYMFSHDDREAAYSVIKENIETTKNTGMTLI